ncbi:beta-galactosidase [Crossiella equi]|uniref:beta-galactosidase n=1 Tax=Crossiella equi TaxID=130796 RepID=A0ABS5A911_9PSEU|nr:glycoside hydrolase family 2 TIM barrel-domain containing protein [Crossiella equi]MBP2473055.1 beta-galactosidase [Crossiella equi]
MSAVLVAGGLMPASAAPDLDVYSYLENPRMLAEGQEPHRAELRPHRDHAAALRGDERTPHTLDLDGDWRIRMADLPEKVPAGFHADGYDVADWRTVKVPHTWQTDGLDHPIFRNIAEEIVPDAPPKVPRDINPTAAYAKDFTLPEGFAGRRTVLRFEGVTSSYFVWVNGVRIGYDQGGYTPAEFDITAALRPGANRLAVQVHRWAAGAYLEDVDQWRFAGIFRSVWLYSTPHSYLSDLTVHTDLDERYRDARLDATVDLARTATGPAGRHTVTATLHDARGAVVATVSKDAELTGAAQRVALSANVTDPAKWTDETPNLYTLVLELAGPDGRITHTTRETVGFREIAIKDRQLLVNGKPILVKGVNRAETDPRHGRHVPRENQLRDVQLMKQLHVNAVRTSHYPSDPHFYDLADQHGLWVDDEVDIETHSHEHCPDNCLADKPEWQDAFLDRFVAMVQRDKNHPSVFMWDTGNEAGLGAGHYRMAEWAKANAPGRPLYHQSNGPDGDAPYADVWGPRYPNPDKLARQGRETKKPVILGEYAHAQGNSLGNFREFWDTMRANPVLQGGFIWDWAEQNLSLPLRLTPDSSPRKITAHLNGMPSLVPGRRGKAVSLSGLDDFVEVYRDRALDLTGPLTLDAWVNPATQWRGDFTVIAKGDHQYALKMKDRETLEFFVYSQGDWRFVHAKVPADFYGNWHRVSGTYDGSALRLYLDGREVGSRSWSGPVNNTPEQVNIGRNSTTHEDHNGRMAHGLVDDVRIYDRALTPAELEGDPSGTAVLALNLDEERDAGRYDSFGAHQSGADGLIDTDRRLQPEAAQLAWAHQPLRFAWADNQLRLTNEQRFAALSGLGLRWRVEEGTKVVGRGESAVDIAPGHTLSVPVALPPNPRDRKRFLTAEVVRANGEVHSRDQFALGGTQVPGAAPPPATARPTVVDGPNRVVVGGVNFQYTVDKRAGTLSSLRANGVEHLKQGPRLDVWRAPVDNELVWGRSEGTEWRAVGLDRLQATVESVAVNGSTIEVRTRVAAPGVTDAWFAQRTTYAVDGAGTVRIGHHVSPQGRMRALAYLPRVGLAFGVPDGFQRFAWYGRQVESYNDRREGSPVGVWRTTVAEEEKGYGKPQEHGNRTDAEWALLTDGRTGGLLVTGAHDVGVSSFDDEDRAEYPFQRVRNAGWTTLHASHAAAGVGETPNDILAKYRVRADVDYSYELVVRPLSRAEVVAGLPAGS